MHERAQADADRRSSGGVPVCILNRFATDATGIYNLATGEVCDLPSIGCSPLQVCLACQQCVP